MKNFKMVTSQIRGYLDIRKVFNGLCLAVVCLMLFFLPIYLMDGNQISPVSLMPPKVMPPKPILAKLTNTSLQSDPAINSSDYKKYLQLKSEIQQKINTLPEPVYKDSKSFITYGEPVSRFLPKNASNVKVILDYTGFFGLTNFLPKDFTCDEKVICRGTNDKSELLSSDAIFFHARDLHGLPKQRLPHQRWMFFVMESPYHMGLNPSELNGVFNYTSTYRSDSDVRKTYFSVGRRSTNLTTSQFNQLFSEIMKDKTRLVAQMNSNCGAPHTERLTYVKKLIMHMPVDTYGACGVLNCPRDTEKCENKMTSYKFYMSMENSNCRDYITEKVGVPLFSWRAVPVVMGGASPKDYENLLPPGSFIHVSWFESPQKLAEYLLLLDRNPKLYQRYHDWRRSFTGHRNDYDNWCKLCRKLHNNSAPVQTYHDFSGWYAQDVCKI